MGQGYRVLGVPNVADRIAQTAAAMLLEEKLEPIFHPDSYGYRPGRSAHDALAVARKRCWKQDWVVDLDIRAFFDSVPHDLLLKAVAHHTDERWVLLYIERWLKAPMQMADGTLVGTGEGDPAGFPDLPPARQPVHALCVRSLDGPGAPRLSLRALRRRHRCPLQHRGAGPRPSGRHRRAARVPRARAASRQDEDRVLQGREPPRDAEHTSFDFLGYTFRARLAKDKRGFFMGFLPAMSDKARKAVGQKIRAWHLNRRSGTDLSGLARDINPQVRGWINYYGAFYRSELYPLARRIDEHLVRWAMQKFKRLRGSRQSAGHG